MLPQGGDAHLAVHVGGGQAAEDMALPVAAHGLGAVVQALPLAAEHGLHRGVAPQRGQHGVVPVEHQQTVLLDVGQQLALGLEDVLPAAQPLDVGVQFQNAALRDVQAFKNAVTPVYHVIIQRKQHKAGIAAQSPQPMIIKDKPMQ